MNCPKCGTSIADRALVCYRCGTPTSEAQRLSPVPRRQGGLLAVVGLVVLVVAALYLGQVQTGQVPRLLSWSLAALGAIVVVWRVLAWRGRS